MDFQSCSLSISYRISNVVHGGVWIFSGIPHCYTSPTEKGFSGRTLGLLSFFLPGQKTNLLRGKFYRDSYNKADSLDSHVPFNLTV